MGTTVDITLSIPEEILRKAEAIAVQRKTTLSGLLIQALADLVRREEGYEQAHQRNLEILDRGLDLGTRGNIPSQRDELHD